MPELTPSPFEMRFDPQTIKHLGLRMYSTLAPAIAELISNAYDADASNVAVTLNEVGGVPSSIVVEDDGAGLSFLDINEKFLVIGRNRRLDEGDLPSPRYQRLPTGKKGLGKLSLFGLASSIRVESVKDGFRNEFVMDWAELTTAKGTYRPNQVVINAPTTDSNGTKFTLTGLKRKSAFDPEELADSLSRMFIVDKSFVLVVQSSNGGRIAIDNMRRYRTLDAEFEWDLSSTLLVPSTSPYFGKLSGKLITGLKPIPPASGLRGVTLFSRGKLVNAPEFFSSSTSSHFYQYLTGWVTVDFVDLLEEDVISTNRQSLNWDDPEMARLRAFVSGVISQVNAEWRRKRKEKKKTDLRDMTGIDTEAWLKTMPKDVQENTQRIIESLGGEDALEHFAPVIKALHEIVPEYPELHWRHLHATVRERVREYYKNRQYGHAASQGVHIYCEAIRKLTGRSEDGRLLVDGIFSSRPGQKPELQINDLSTESLRNIQDGQAHLSRGVVVGFRNPISHHPMDSVVPSVFTELDCLNVLSVTSYLITRLDKATCNRSD
jgi:uncharacterized protein (TIGR02391 family)